GARRLRGEGGEGGGGRWGDRGRRRRPACAGARPPPGSAPWCRADAEDWRRSDTNRRRFLRRGALPARFRRRSTAPGTASAPAWGRTEYQKTLPTARPTAASP